jgi:DNA polymerase V
VLVFIRTSPFRPQDRQYSRSITVPLRLPSADTLRIAGAALEGLKRIFRPGYRYAKAGVMLLDLQPAGVQAQQELDLGGDDTHRERRNGRLMAAMDAIQDRFGKEAIRLGATLAPTNRAGFSAWQMKQERRSPRYTTDWAGLMVVGA